MRGEHGIKHAGNGALFGNGQRPDLFKLLRDLGLWSALAGAALGLRAEQIFHAKDGTKFLEKTLEDGRGVRLNMDGTFKGFIDK